MPPKREDDSLVNFDILIRNGLIVDGSGEPAFSADVGIVGERIEAVGDLEGCEAETVIDASDLIVTPGLIDAHTHADKTLMIYPGAENYRTQGITTVVGGNCGSGPAPLGEYYLQGYWDWDWWYDVNPRMYYEEVVADLQPAAKAMRKHHGIDLDWRSFGEFFDRLRTRRPGVNLVPLVGHNAVRGTVMGHDYRREATNEEIEEMKDLVARAMDDGVRGISNGLDYAPGAFAGHEELVAVIGEAAKRGGIFTSHWRRTGLRQGMGNPVLIKGLREALQIARDAAVPKVQISHVLNGYSVFPESPDELIREGARLTLGALEEAIEEGLNVHWDVIPNTNGGTLSGRFLASGLTPWLKMSGNLEGLARNLRAPDFRAQIRDYIESGNWYSLNPVTNPGWASGIIVASHDDSSLVERPLAEIAEERGTDALDTLFDLLVEDPLAESYPAPGSEIPHRVFFRHPRTMVALDTFSVDDTYDIKRPPYMRAHPNAYAGMPRYFQHFGRPLLGLEEAVRRVSSLPAEVFELEDRGLLREGYLADVAVWNPDEYEGNATFCEPRRYADGIHHLIVNGVFTLRDGNLSEDRAGRILTR